MSVRRKEKRAPYCTSKGSLGAAAPKRPFRPFWAAPKGPRAGARNVPVLRQDEKKMGGGTRPSRPGARNYPQAGACQKAPAPGTKQQKGRGGICLLFSFPLKWFGLLLCVLFLLGNGDMQLVQMLLHFPAGCAIPQGPQRSDMLGRNEFCLRQGPAGAGRLYGAARRGGAEAGEIGAYSAVSSSFSVIWICSSSSCFCAPRGMAHPAGAPKI